LCRGRGTGGQIGSSPDVDWRGRNRGEWRNKNPSNAQGRPKKSSGEEQAATDVSRKKKQGRSREQQRRIRNNGYARPRGRLSRDIRAFPQTIREVGASGENPHTLTSVRGAAAENKPLPARINHRSRRSSLRDSLLWGWVLGSYREKRRPANHALPGGHLGSAKLRECEGYGHPSMTTEGGKDNQVW